MKRLPAAIVDEDRCIGCARCLEACPVDAIVGAQGLMHTVVESWCIGCRLCVPPCPVDCIDMLPPKAAWTENNKRAAKDRAKARQARQSVSPFQALPVDRQGVIAAALARRKRL